MVEIFKGWHNPEKLMGTILRLLRQKAVAVSINYSVIIR